MQNSGFGWRFQSLGRSLSFDSLFDMLIVSGLFSNLYNPKGVKP